jgi:hypothetical protein
VSEFLPPCCRAARLRAFVRPRAQKRTAAGARADVRRDVRTVTIPVTLRLPERAEQSEVSYLEDLQVFEDGERQEILATRGAGARR